MTRPARNPRPGRRSRHGAPCNSPDIAVTRLRVLLSEASSLTAREHLTVLGTARLRVKAMSSDQFALGG